MATKPTEPQKSETPQKTAVDVKEPQKEAVDGKKKVKILVVDPALCVGCEVCESVCSMVHDNEFNREWNGYKPKRGIFAVFPALKILESLVCACTCFCI